MRKLLGAVLAVIVLWASGARAENTLDIPDSFGDQVIFYYDARPDFTTFIALRNGSDTVQAVNILFYGPDFDTPFSRIMALPAGVLTILDVGALRSEGLPAEPGVALATTIDANQRPVASGAIAGNFTVANLLTGSAFGAGGAARSALTSDGDGLTIGTPIGPGTGVLQPIRPQSALLAAYYDPATLAPAASGGNQLIFINFLDTYAPTFGAAKGSTTWQVKAASSNGVGFPDRILTVDGVAVTDLASVLGAGANGSGGGITFIADADTEGLTRLVFFAEALGTFGTGYLLPPLKGALRIIQN